MSKIPFDVGHYDIREALLSTYDGNNEFNIANFITEMIINESVEINVMSGYCVIADTYNILDKLPIKGEEVFRLTYADFYDEEVTQEFFVYNVSSMVPLNEGTGVAYMLHFVSPLKFLSDKTKIQKYYKGNIHDIIQKIYDEYLNNSTFTLPEVEIEETSGEQKLIIPSLTPLSAIEFLRRRSYSTVSKSSNFYHFQTRKGHHFCTYEKLLEDRTSQALTFTYNPNMLSSVANRSLSMNSALSFSVEKTPSTLSEMNNGSMVSEITKIDLVEKTYERSIYSHKDQFDEYSHNDVDNQFHHSDSFSEDFFNSENPPKSYLVFKDSSREEHAYEKILGPRQSNKYYTTNIMCEIEIYGRNDLNCGDVIALDLPKLENIQGDREIHQSLSGYWFVHTINHHFTSEKDYRMKVLLTKDSYRLRV